MTRYRAEFQAMCDFIVSQPAPTQLRSARQEGFDLHFLVDWKDGSSVPLLPLLSDFTFLPQDGRERPFSYEDARVNLQLFLSTYRAQLRCLDLLLFEPFWFEGVLAACFQCPGLQSLRIDNAYTSYSCQKRDGLLTEPASVYPRLPFLHRLQLLDARWGLRSSYWLYCEPAQP